MRSRDASAILRVMPRNQETGVPRDAVLLVAAPRPLDHHSTAGVRVEAGGLEVEGVLDISSDGRLLFWSPARAMEAQAEHHVTISGMRDERGARFADHASTFVTGPFSYVDLHLSSD